jgi:hypothetical protein
MNMSNVLRRQLTADASHTIHLVLPPEMGDEVEIIVFPRYSSKDAAQQESLAMARMMDETGFAKNVLNSAEEDCWNDL